MEGIFVVRFITGILLAIHGTQAFRGEEMNEYVKWMNEIGVPFPLFSVYFGKAVELAGGLLLSVGLFTKIASGLLLAVFLFITVFMGEGKILEGAQHPFLFAMLAFCFLCIGPGKYSLDYYFSRK